MNKKQSGFSLIELLMIMVILGIITTVAIPYLLKAVHRSEERNALASLRTFASAQVSYYSSKGRFARLDELNAAAGSGLGTDSPPNLIRGKFTIVMSPRPVPTDDELKDAYTIVATKPASASETSYVVAVDQTGAVSQIFPIPSE